MSSFPNEIQTYKLVIYGLPAPNLNPKFLSLFIVLLHSSYHPWIALPPRSPHSIWNPSSHSHLIKYYVSLKISSKNTFPSNLHSSHLSILPTDIYWAFAVFHVPHKPATSWPHDHMYHVQRFFCTFPKCKGYTNVWGKAPALKTLTV